MQVPACSFLRKEHCYYYLIKISSDSNQESKVTDQCTKSNDGTTDIFINSIKNKL